MDEVAEVLKRTYFDLLSQEDYPNTPKITKQLDDIEKGIEKITGRPIPRSKVQKSKTKNKS